jgi:hypothetical protein
MFLVTEFPLGDCGIQIYDLRWIHLVFLLRLFLPQITQQNTSWTSACVFHEFGQPIFAYSSSILSWSQFSLMLKLPQKMRLPSKVTIDSKIIILLPLSKSVKLTIPVPDSGSRVVRRALRWSGPRPLFRGNRAEKFQAAIWSFPMKSDLYDSWCRPPP